MMIETVTGATLDCELVKNYFGRLVDLFFKILPMYESGEMSLKKYMTGLRDEMIGCSDLIESIKYDSLYLSLLANLQFLIGVIENPECDKNIFKQKIFGSISTCNKLAERYGEDEN